MRQNECLIDWLRFSIADKTVEEVTEQLLGIPIYEFENVGKASPFPTYDNRLCFANIEIHTSKTHGNILVNLSGTACRQYEEYMSKADGWHWHAFINEIILMKGKPTRLDLALDIFDDSSPNVRKLQDYIKRGQLSTKAQSFKEINSGRILDGVLTGFTLYIGSLPQMLRIYDKKQEVRDNTGEVLQIEKWVRWELELSDQKSLKACELIAQGKPLNTLIRGILGSHYAFKTQPKGKKDFHNKTRWKNMRWWDSFIENIPNIPLRVTKEKPTMKEKKQWIEKSTTKSWAMVYEVYKQTYGKDYADAYLREEIEIGKSKFSEYDRTMIEQSINEILGEKEI